MAPLHAGFHLEHLPMFFLINSPSEVTDGVVNHWSHFLSWRCNWWKSLSYSRNTRLKENKDKKKSWESDGWIMMFVPHNCIFLKRHLCRGFLGPHLQLRRPRPISISCTSVCGAGSRCSQSPHLWVLGCHLILLMKASLPERSGCKKKEKKKMPSLPPFQLKCVN